MLRKSLWRASATGHTLINWTAKFMNIGDIQQQSLKPVIRIELLLINYYLKNFLAYNKPNYMGNFHIQPICARPPRKTINCETKANFTMNIYLRLVHYDQLQTKEARNSILHFYDKYTLCWVCFPCHEKPMFLGLEPVIARAPLNHGYSLSQSNSQIHKRIPNKTKPWEDHINL